MFGSRWSAAKGIGRLVSRLNKNNGDDVVSCVMDVLDFRNNEGAWSGACLAIAELGKFTPIFIAFKSLSIELLVN